MLWVSSETAALARNWARMTEHEIALGYDRLWEKRKRRERSRAIRRAWTLERERQEKAVRSFWSRIEVEAPIWARIRDLRLWR